MPRDFKNAIISWPINNPKKSILLAFSLLLSFAYFINNFDTDFGAKVWFRPQDPHLQKLNEFEKTFGNDESFVLVVDAKEGVFNTKFLSTLNEITEKMWLVPEVIRVESLSNYYWSYANQDDIVTEPFLPEEELANEDFIKERKNKALKHNVIPGVYISREADSALIYARIVYNPEKEPDYKKIYLAVEKLISEYKDRNDIAFHLLGQPALSYTFQKISFDDVTIMTPLLLLLVVIYLIYCFRSFNGLFLPLLVIFLSAMTLLGIIGYLGLKLNSLTMILPSILIAIGIADSVHILSTYYDKYLEFNGDKKRACFAALEKNLWPVFLTSISTAIGFFSLVSSDIAPVSDLGLLAGIGTLLAMIYSYLILAPILILRRGRSSKESFHKKVLPKEIVERYLRFIEKNKGWTIILFIFLSTSGITLALMNEVNSNPYEYFKYDNKISIGNRYVLDNYGGAGGPEVVIDSGTEEGAKNPDFLKKVETFQNWLEAQNYVNKVISIIDILKEVNQSLFGGETKEYRIHTDRGVIAQELFLYTMGLPAGMDINNRIDVNNRKLRLSILWSVQDSKTSLSKMEEIHEYAKKLGLNISLTGKPILFQMMNSYVVYTFFTSMGMALLLITIILIFVFSSLRHGLLSLIPNFMPIIFGAGFLTLISTPIDIGCAIVASVTLGIAVDDTIHFLSHYNKLVREGRDNFSALVEVLTTTGLALLITTLILVSCFGLFIFAELVPNMNFGILSALVLTFALVCDLLFLPALILFFGKNWK